MIKQRFCIIFCKNEELNQMESVTECMHSSSMVIEPRLLMSLWFQIQHYPFWANWVFACNTETLESLYSSTLLILTYTSKSKIQVVHEHKFKDPLAHVRLAQKRQCWTWNQKLIRGLGSIPTRCKCLNFYNCNLHNIARCDRIGFMTKNPNVNVLNLGLFQA